MTVISEYLAELGFNAIKDFTEENINEAKLKRDLKKYIESQKKYFDMCSLADEYDYQGLMEYISAKLMDDVKKRFCSANSRVRGRARKNIIDAAVSYSSADTDAAKAQVGKLIGNSLDIIRAAIVSEICLKDYYLASEVVDSVKENTDETVLASENRLKQMFFDSHDNQKQELLDAKDQILQSVHESKYGGALFSYNNLMQKIDHGDFESIQRETKRYFDVISLEHPLNPDYGYEYRNGKLVSVACTERARKCYPPRFNFKGTIRAGDYYFNDPSVDPFDYAYRHQIQLLISVTEAKKLLGNIEDPSQEEANGLAGKEIVVTPREFPPAFPCAIKVGRKTFFDYIELRTREILDDGTYILNNDEQTNACVRFEIRININSPVTLEFKFETRSASNRQLLIYNKFIAELDSAKDLHCYNLELGKDILAGKVNDFDIKTGFANIDEEIDFLERICSIEDNFDVALVVPEEITEEEYQAVLSLSELIKHDKVESKWYDLTLTGKISKAFRASFQATDEIFSMLSYVGTCNYRLFNTRLEFKLMRTFKSAKLQNPDKIKELIQICDVGDPIKVTFIPGEDNTFIDTLKIPENMLMDTENDA